MDKTKQSQIATDFDRLIVDIAACDDLDVIEYYHEMLRYIDGIAEYRKATLQSAGYGAFLGEHFKKRFDTKDQAHDYLVAKIVAIHDCDEDEITWEDHDDVGYCRSYWIGDRGFMFRASDALATISSVDEDDKRIHVFRFGKEPPDMFDDIDYQSHDEAAQKLAHLVKENEILKSKLLIVFRKLKWAWDEVNRAKACVKGNSEAAEGIKEWLKSNKDFLRNEP